MTQPHLTSSSPDLPTPPCVPASGTDQTATSSDRSEPATALQSLSAHTRKGAALIVVTPWTEIVAMMAGVVLLAVLAVAALLVVGAAAVLVIPVAVPAAVLVLALVALVKVVVRTADDD